MAVHVMYTYCQSYCGMQGYSDRYIVGNDVVAVHVMYTYCQSYCGMQGYSDREVMM